MRYEDNLVQMRGFAHRVTRRAYAIGASTLSFDDVMQELAVAWCLARDNWRPDRGASFSTYLQNGMRLHIQSFMRDRLRRCVNDDFTTVSMDASTDEETTLHDKLPSAHPASDEVVNESQTYRILLRCVSENARIFLTLLTNTPPELVRELEKVQQRQDYARARGIGVSAASTALSGLIFDLMGLERSERARIIAELKQVGASLRLES